ncbi:MAG: HNH endonuclease [Desulfobacterales bacterium]|nr:HNH endonuclease [Desulfobacterales bacterium]
MIDSYKGAIKYTDKPAHSMIPISEKAYRRKKENSLLGIERGFFRDRARRYNVTENELLSLWQVQYAECALCGDELEYDGTTHIDHIVPRKSGGKDSIKNLQFVCAKCNYAKRDLLTKDFIILCLKVAKKHEFKISASETMNIVSRIWRSETKEERRKYSQEYLKELQNQENNYSRT